MSEPSPAWEPVPTCSVLDNGLRVATEEVPSARSVAIGLWVDVGRRDESPEIAGASHFLEHLLFKGTERVSARDVAEAIEGRGGDFNASTGRETTSFTLRVPARYWAEVLDLLGHLVVEPALRPHDVDAERNVILEELYAALDSPEDCVHQLANEALFPDHPLGAEILGSVDSVANMTAADVRAFLESRYVAGSMVLTVAGPVPHGQVASAADRLFGAFRAGQGQDRVPVTRPPRDRVIEGRDTEQVQTIRSWRGLPSDDPDRFALYVANQILGGAVSSRLFQAAREDRGLAYSISSWTTSFSDSGAWSVYSAAGRASHAELAEVIDAELDRWRSAGPDPAEVARAIAFVEGSTEMAFEDQMSRAARLGRELLSGRTPTPISEQLDRVRGVDTEAVGRVIGRVQGPPASVVTLGPEA